ncbi:MAG: DnaA regulatory inactivator Hda [Porticoccaceae bacterium]|nr:DnaA regulatory inactivator Hda [Porticoccaceae bacterium]
MMVTSQLSLPLSLRDEATFGNFLAPTGSVRAQVVDLLQNLARGVDEGETSIYLWGGEGAGCSHLLQAACHEYQRQGRGVQYLPLDELCDLEPDGLLADLEHQALVCLAHIEAVAGNHAWELAIFNLFNRMRESGSLLLIGADRPPRELPVTLPDLQSRLTWSLVFHLPFYGEMEKVAILRFRAARLGIELGEEVAAFILNRGERSLATLMSYLARLDKASLCARRRVTIPFVKAAFGW